MAHAEEVLGAPDGSALTWILDHCLRYPGTYEIPLRTMYALNSNPTRYANETTRSNRSSGSSNLSISSAQNQNISSWDAAAELRAQLSHQISRLPTQPCSLPPSFITSFLRRCFSPVLDEVDFPQALTALDYLKDLDSRRRKEVAATLRRLGVETDTPNSQAELKETRPATLSWIESMNVKIRRAESLYSQIYIGLRRWTLLNEMLLSEPYNKANCIALLNTLFPPVTEFTVTPTPQLSTKTLKAQRDGFFRYITAVDTNGKQILEKLMMQGAREGETNNWTVIREALDKYLRLANEIIDECTAVTGPASLGEDEFRRGRKVDSGISFVSAHKPMSSVSSGPTAEDLDKPLPPSPNSKRGGSTLERLARELRKLGDSGVSKNLRKMKSSAALSSRPGTPSPTEQSSFDMDDQKRRRFLWEASNRRTHSKQPSSDSQ
ncbi:uncharacterized protein EURHEDRAFT_448938 [Aspergillus ruber CBS 135680]|uniref:Uncharacterized protein n=1 Tax=Aspergillus ruber (strain CBS 135680) TaxID=1388766 RepID=A0A017SNG5_ASPRC|nr:uncharacterized protein EURHEDRAFT_448938 [Aspergillus ruber CBS 135680]EYE98149.1 hypothetical protein EURHEDRAFT_448938 [Aspergillus ruber CBS 135680]